MVNFEKKLPISKALKKIVTITKTNKSSSCSTPANIIQEKVESISRSKLELDRRLGVDMKYKESKFKVYYTSTKEYIEA